MYIEPNTIIKLYERMPLDRSYTNTLYFDSLSAQTSFFHTNNKYHKITLTRQSYQRVERGKMRIGVSASEIYTCNYLAFQNSSYGNKWFYGFITGVEYINNETADVSFQIDILQSYFFNLEFKNCFIERQHTLGDAIGENIVEEPIATGDYIYNSFQKSGLFDEYCVVLATTEGDLFSDNTQAYSKYTGYVGGLPSLITYIVFDAYYMNDFSDSALSYIKTVLDGLLAQNKVDGIISLSLIPKALVPTGKETTTKIFNTSRPATLGGYKPKNNKLYTYPYSYLSIENGKSEQIYRYEYFTEPTAIKFEIDSTLSATPEFSMTPKNYMNVEKNYLKKQVISDFPFLAYSIDSYKQWLATSSQSYNIGVVGGLLNLGGGFSSGITPHYTYNTDYSKNLSSSFPLQNTSGLFSLLQASAQASVEQSKGDRVQGQNSGTIDIATRAKDFYTIHKTLTPSYLKIVDDYFTRYGYAIKRCQVPIFNARPHYTYIKTQGAIVAGGAPADDIARICDILNNGITFWKDASEVGNYSVDNKGII